MTIQGILRKAKWDVLKKIHEIRKNLARRAYHRTLNRGERYDPSIYQGMEWSDPCHIPRYEFAKAYIQKTDDVLDIACGTGYGTAILATYCRHITGVDIDSSALKYAKKNYSRKNITLVQSDIFKYKTIVDVVVSFETIEHIKTRSIRKTLQKLALLSKRTLIGSVPYKEKRGNNPYHMIFDIDESDFSILKTNGKIDFYYQYPDGAILTKKKTKPSPQNLLFIFNQYATSN